MNVSLVSASILGLCFVLSGCLFEKNEGTFTYTTEVYGDVKTIHTRNADGTVHAPIGVGVEIRDGDGFFPETGSLRLWPYSSSDDTLESWIPSDDSSLVSDLIIDTNEDEPFFPAFLALTRDSSYLLQIRSGLLLPQLVVTRAFAGLPCRFSNLRAFQAQSGITDTIWLNTTGHHLSRTAEGVRLAILIDSAESKADDSRANFQNPVIALVDVTCPEP